ncbi:MAG: FHA domain-containing protein [Micrococcales bacterium]|nr:FHA domain-containing protein [Micrococcales bacterium]
MNELAVTFLRLSYLLLLWLFVVAVLTSLRRDVYGLSITRRRSRTPRTGRGRAIVKAPLDGPTSAAQPLRDAPTKVVVASGPLRGTTLPLGAGIVIGRSSGANLILDDEFTSGRHARIMPDAQGWILEDLGSTNGTFLGRDQVQGPVRVHAGQQVRIGQTRLDLARS